MLLRIRPFTPVFVLVLLLGALFQPESLAQGLDSQLKSVADKVVAGCTAAGAKRVTVADFTDLQGQVTELGRFVAEELGSSLVDAAPSFGVVDRANLRTILAEHKLNMSGLVNPDTVRKVGQIAGVDGIVMGTITPLGDTVRIAVKVIATETATIMATARTDVARTKAIEELLGRSVDAPALGSVGANATSSAAAGSRSNATAPRTSPAAHGVFENRLLRLAVRSLKSRSDGDVILSVQVDVKTPSEAKLGCYPVELVDENGERWEGRGDIVTNWRHAQLAPGTPLLDSLTFSRAGRQADGRRFDLSAKCECIFQGRSVEFPMTIAGIAVSE